MRQIKIKLESFKKTIEDNNVLYESLLDKTTQSLEKIISNTESLSKIQQMYHKNIIRKKYSLLRKKKYFDISKNFFNPLLSLSKSKYQNKRINLALYHPSYYELNVLKVLDIKYFSHQNSLLPRIDKKKNMNFYLWKKDC